MTNSRYLVVNADDFGQSAGVNHGIMESFENGIVTSASLMVRWPAAAEAATYAREHRALSVGLHLDLGEWAYRKGEWVPLYEVVRKDDKEAVADEISRQLSTFQELVGKTPSHIDSHQHVHRSGPARSILLEAAATLGVPLRSQSEIRYEGSFYGQTEDGVPLIDNISINALKEILRVLPPGVTELGCHPAKEIDFDTMYGRERLMELEVLCSGEVREFMGTINMQLCSFHSAPRTHL